MKGQKKRIAAMLAVFSAMVLLLFGCTTKPKSGSSVTVTTTKASTTATTAGTTATTAGTTATTAGTTAGATTAS